MHEDHYSTLGVDKSATKDQIKKAYRNLAQKHHPDKFTDPKDKQKAEAEFKKISNAYSILSDENKKSQYDNPQSDHGDIFDFFHEVFNISQINYDIDVVIDVSLEDIDLGTKKEFKYERSVVCHSCVQKAIKCPKCGGYGKFKSIFSYANCANCGGSGSVIEPAGCTTCKGTGSIINKKTATINVPKGVSDGQVISIRGEGNISIKHRGNLHCHFREIPHNRFKRHNYDLVQFVNLSIKQACLGDNISIPLLHNKHHNFNIPSGTQFNEKFIINGKGIAGHGDMIVVAKIEIPKNLSKEAIAAIEQFDLVTGETSQ